MRGNKFLIVDPSGFEPLRYSIEKERGKLK